jgi:hypothetical protein
MRLILVIDAAGTCTFQLRQKISTLWYVTEEKVKLTNPFQHDEQ